MSLNLDAAFTECIFMEMEPENTSRSPAMCAQDTFAVSHYKNVPLRKRKEKKNQI